MRRARDRRRAERAGLSRAELLVILICLALVVAIALPMILERREVQRRVMCQDRLRKLGVTAANYVVDHDGDFPWLVDETLPESVPWTAALVPYLPDGEMYAKRLEEMKADETFTIPEFLCPNGRAYDRGANSYVGNGGFGDFGYDVKRQIVFEEAPHSPYLDWDGDGEVSDEDVGITRASGIFWRVTPDHPVPPITIDGVARADGTSNTLWFTENQNARRWRSAETFDLAFVVGRDRIPFTMNPPEIEPGHEIDLGPYRINAFPTAKPGESPAPSSTHGGGVNVMFVDGSVRFLAEQVDPLIYLRAMTPSGENPQDDY